MAFGGDSERFVCSVSIIESREFQIEANSNNLSYVHEKFVYGKLRITCNRWDGN